MVKIYVLYTVRHVLICYMNAIHFKYMRVNICMQTIQQKRYKLAIHALLGNV